MGACEPQGEKGLNDPFGGWTPILSNFYCQIEILRAAPCGLDAVPLSPCVSSTVHLSVIQLLMGPCDPRISSSVHLSVTNGTLQAADLLIRAPLSYSVAYGTL